MSGGVVYEVRLAVDGVDSGDVDRWLERHVEAMLALPGFVDCEVSVPEDAASSVDQTANETVVRRVTRYRLRDREALERYLDKDASTMRADGIDRFGDALSTERQIYGLNRESSIPTCLNCGAPLSSQYCAECGQRASTRLVSLWQLLADALGDVLDVDSRLWGTLKSLTFRPGHLTREYLNGRRAAYMPPFRTYLFLSLTFFVLIALLPNRDAADVDDALVDARQELADEIAAERADDDSAEIATNEATNAVAADDDGVTVSTDEEGCHRFAERVGERFGIGEARLHVVCERMSEDDFGPELLDDIVERIPTALFFFLPLIALVLKLLYPLSRRYYVEHLLFIVHFQAFLFLVLIVDALFEAIVVPLPVLSAPETLFSVALVLYVPYYLYRAMREVYRQSRLATILKYLVLVNAYFVAALIVFLGAAVLSILSV